ncbi:angiopoietin-2-like [Dysidea avara]|uniref:angiopoietin-2-like n=1 Tax=Dysidea avara TaxID=196820 RepID=UPI0033261A3A
MTTITITTIILLLAIEKVLSSGQQTNSTHVINSCCDLQLGCFTFSRTTRKSGIYVVTKLCSVDDQCETEAYCDTINGGGGWLVVQRRQDESVDFNRTWVGGLLFSGLEHWTGLLD